MSDVTGAYESVAAALQALNRCWCEDRPPTHAEGLMLQTAAVMGLAELAAHAGVPPPSLRPPP